VSAAASERHRPAPYRTARRAASRRPAMVASAAQNSCSQFATFSVFSRCQMGRWPRAAALTEGSESASADRRFRPGLLTRLFATLSRQREQGQHSWPQWRLTRHLKARLTLSAILAQQRKSSRKSREKPGFLRAVPNLSGVLTPLLRFRNGQPGPWSDSLRKLSPEKLSPYRSRERKGAKRSDGISPR
jgi:hypothetical protein